MKLYKIDSIKEIKVDIKIEDEVEEMDMVLVLYMEKGHIINILVNSVIKKVLNEVIDWLELVVKIDIY